MKRQQPKQPCLPFPRSRYQIFPPLPPDRHNALEQSVLAHGVESATTWDGDGVLLDGWERESICNAHGLPCPKEVRHFDSEGDKFRFLLAVNAHRRPCLSSTQKRAVIEAYLLGDPEIADNSLAQALGVSKNTVFKVRSRLEATRQIKKVKKTKGKDGKLRPVQYSKRVITNSPNEFEKALEVIKDLPDNCGGKTLDIITASRRARRNKTQQERAEKIIEQLPDDPIRLYHCPFQQLEAAAGLAPASSTLVLTDIPYDQGFLSQLPDLAQFAMRVLVEGGLFVTYSGTAYLNKVLRILEDNGLKWRWGLKAEWEGNANIVHPLNVASNWLPVLVFSKGDWRERKRWNDVLPSCPKEKDWHDWQRPLAQVEVLVRYFSEPGDLVVDPCGGGFTTAIACHLLSRGCISCDIDAEAVQKGLARFAKVRGQRNNYK